MQKLVKSQRITKDLSFLLDLQEQEILPGLIYKYQIEQGEREGQGDTIEQIKLPCAIYLSFTKYDYEGRYHSHVLNVSVKHPDQKPANIPEGAYQSMLKMKKREKSWFNIIGENLHETPGLSHEGCHFEIIIHDIKYKNSDNILSKRLVNERNRSDAKNLLEEKKPEEAIKKYKNIINITEGLQKGKFSLEELKQIEEMNLKAKQNLLRCLLKIDEVEERKSYLEEAKKYLTQLRKKRQQNILSLFLSAKVLFYMNDKTDSEEFAKKYCQKDPCPESKALLKQIQDSLKK